MEKGFSRKNRTGKGEGKHVDCIKMAFDHCRVLADRGLAVAGVPVGDGWHIRLVLGLALALSRDLAAAGHGDAPFWNQQQHRPS